MRARSLDQLALADASVEAMLEFLRVRSLDAARSLVDRVDRLHTWILVQDRLGRDVSWASVGWRGPHPGDIWLESSNDEDDGDGAVRALRRPA